MHGKEEIVIRPEYSAVGAKSRTKPSRSIQAAILAFKDSELSRIAEIGCGLLANTPHILEAFASVVLVDTEHQYTRIKDKLDELSKLYPSFEKFIDTESFQDERMQLEGAIIVNVLHVLATVQERAKLLKAAHRNLKKRGLLFVDIPRNETFYRSLVRTARPYNDGYIMRRGSYYTFYKNMTFDELEGYAEKAGFQLQRRIYLDHRVTFICRK